MMHTNLMITITDTGALFETLGNLPEEYFQQAKTVFEQSLGEAKEAVLANASEKLRVRTGALYRSVRAEVAGNSLSTLSGKLMSASEEGPLPYAAIHEYGSTIRAKHAYQGVPGGPYLNIPVYDNRDADGGMKRSPKAVFREGGFIQKTRKGNWGVFLGKTSQRADMMFVLKKEIRIPARLGMREAANHALLRILRRLSGLKGE